MDSIWMQCEEEDTWEGEGDSWCGVFTDKPSVIGAALPRPLSPIMRSEGIRPLFDPSAVLHQSHEHLAKESFGAGTVPLCLRTVFA
jgi:hypothetical protein